MYKKYIYQGPVSIEDVKYQFKNWRKTREKRCPIPEELWNAAVRLTQDYSVSHVARTLRLNYTRLKQRVTDFQPDTEEDRNIKEEDTATCLPLTISQEDSGIQISLIIPGHPCLGIFKYFGTVPLKIGDIVERVDIVELAGMDQAHEQITNVSSMLCFVKQGVFPMHDSPFEYLLTQIVIQRSAGNLQKHGQLSPVLDHVRTCFANGGIRLNLFLLQLLMEPLLKIVHQRAAFFLMQYETQFR